MQLAGVVQEDERGQPLKFAIGDETTERAAQAVTHDRETRDHLEAARDVCAMMRQMVAGASLSVELAPWRLHPKSSQARLMPCRAVAPNRHP